MWLGIFSLIIFYSCVAANPSPTGIASQIEPSKSAEIINGDANFDAYLPLIKGKKIGIVGNQTSVIGKTHLVDTLLAQGVDIVALFSPEHGFRGDADAGATIKDGKDQKTGLPIISLYGNNKKPKTEQLKGIDILLFDLQDVGVRFYTYISTLHYIMEAAAENDIQVIVLDRPNPNAYYVDGPVLDKKWSSFIGMHPVPVVYGMTIGEYAQMINGEYWLQNRVQCHLTVIPLENYTHQTRVHLPIPPSPNLRSDDAIDVYPSLCLFEATTVSVGRGTDSPFEVIGHPKFPSTGFSFTPKSSYGAQDPLWKNQLCHGIHVTKEDDVLHLGRLNLHYFLQAKTWLEKANQPFLNKNNLLEKLIGTDDFRKQVENGDSEEAIRKSWAEGLDQFKKIRAKYLIYE